MGFTAVVLLGGVLVGLVAGGRPSNIARRSLRWWPLVTTGLLLQLAAEIGGAAGWAVVALSYASLTAFAVRNLRLVGMPVVLVGLALNMTVIGVNGGMPVRLDAIRAAGQLSAEDARSVDFGAKRHLADDSDRLVVLGDVIPVRPTREVASFGDLVLAFGVANVLFRLLRPAGNLGHGGPASRRPEVLPAVGPTGTVGTNP